MKTALLLLLVSCYAPLQLFAGDTTWIKVEFIYGSKPKKEFKKSEHHWFGGRWGGHCGIETDSVVLSFVPAGRFKLVHSKKPFGNFIIQDVDNFWQGMGYDGNQVKKAIIAIPINAEQKKILDSLVKERTWNPPYAYAFFGMRCSSAAYDLLSDIGVMPHKTTISMIFRYFYPRLLRRKMFRTAYRHGWNIEMQGGAQSRKWDFD